MKELYFLCSFIAFSLFATSCPSGSGLDYENQSSSSDGKQPSCSGENSMFGEGHFEMYEKYWNFTGICKNFPIEF